MAHEQTESWPNTPFLISLFVPQYNPSIFFFIFFWDITIIPLVPPFSQFTTDTHSHISKKKKRRGQSVECNHKGQEKERQQLSINAEIRWVVGMKQGLRRVCARVLRY